MAVTDISQNSALKFVVLLGFISLFGDITYEGARSITGPYLATLGASATVVGFVAGLGELIGYGLRLVSGYLADRTKRYWLITIVGYCINLLAVPALALTGHWPTAAALMVMERFGKAVRTPARDAMLSHAGQSMGMGWGFGLHEAMDQIGAMLGPLIIAAVLYYHGSYRTGFAILAIPAFLALMVLAVAYRLYPRPHDLEQKFHKIEAKGNPQAFWFYLAGAALIAAGYADFPLIAYHFQKAAVLSMVWIPLAYAVAMGIDGLMAPVLGWLYDRFGFITLMFITVISAFFAPLVFFGGSKLALLGVVIWAVGMGSQGSLMRAVVGNMIPIDKRASAYGVFNAFYGLFWFLGSVTMGMLYDKSIMALVIFSVVLQLLALPLFIKVMQKL